MGIVNISNEFLEDEVREGFFVSSIIKRAWANGLQLLATIDDICQKNDILYFLDWGSLLGAVRHGGFIPWDDDIDIVMHRSEVDKLVKICEEQYKDNISVVTFENSDNHWKFIVEIRNTDRMCFTPEYLSAHYNFPYITAIDIFVMDNICDDEVLEKERSEKCKYLLTADNAIGEGILSFEQKKVLLDMLKSKFGINFDGTESDINKRRLILRRIKKELEKFNDRETSYVAQMMPWGINQNRYYPREFFCKSRRVPFEGIEVSIPVNAEQLLGGKYGDYTKIIRGGSLHDYPCFEEQRALLGANVDIYPHYEFDKEALNYVFDDSMSLKQITKEYLKHLKDAVENINKLERSNNINSEQRLEFLSEEQEMAIDFGTLVEKVKGEGTDTVGWLEKYCELLYAYAEQKETSFCTDELLSNIIHSAESEILERKEILFLSYKAESWKVFDKIYKAIDRDNVDITVISLPYGYKEYDGTVNEYIVSDQDYPEEIKLTNSDIYDFSLHCPDVVYIQNPYDQYNLATMVPEKFFAGNIRKHAGKIVYIPYLEVEDFVSTDLPQKYNMQYFVYTPGVAMSDTIYLSSETMKKRYVEMLTGWAGEETVSIWEDKIAVISSGTFEK